ncbi:MAG: hypothetical protein HYW62_04100 [Candidatus Levybacteria bacterium]|nr:hypothetical protein [Candidatus Levybacteria bacterium]
MSVENRALPSEARFEIPEVNEELYTLTLEALAKEGYTFVTPIKPLAINHILFTDKEIEALFGDVNIAEALRNTVSLQMKVAINPNSILVENSNNLGAAGQDYLIGEREFALKGKLPFEVRHAISMSILNASATAQLDFEYRHVTGKLLLLPDQFVRTSEQNLIVGRPSYENDNLVPDPSPLHIFSWPRNFADRDVFVIQAVVLPRKMATLTP